VLSAAAMMLLPRKGSTADAGESQAPATEPLAESVS
jgi:hypothetical protein